MKQRVRVKIKVPKARNKQLNDVLRRCKSGKMKDKRKDRDSKLDKQLELA